MASSASFWSRTGTTSTTPAVVRLPSDWTELKIYVDALSLAQVGSTYAAPAVASVNGIITISSLGTPTAGTFKLSPTIGGQRRATTSALTYDESAADVKTALIGMTPDYFDTGDITAAGGALPTAITLTFTGVYATSAPGLEVVEADITGGVIQARVTTQPAGNGGYGYIEASSQEVWQASNGGPAPFLYIATVASTGNYRIAAYR